MSNAKKSLVFGIFMASFSGTILSADFSSAKSLLGIDEPAGPDLFSANELSMDLFGFGASRDKDGKGDTAWGLGLGANYFFTRNIGVGADSYADAFEIPYLLNGSGIFRYPINDSRFAVYGFGGFGRQWKHSPQWLGHLGVGGEYRFNPKGGFFVDVREEFPDETKDYTVFRFGFRIKFK
jgi:hypothetical protein